jgi:hypothetical protein
MALPSEDAYLEDPGLHERVELPDPAVPEVLLDHSIRTELRPRRGEELTKVIPVRTEDRRIIGRQIIHNGLTRQRK